VYLSPEIVMYPSGSTDLSYHNIPLHSVLLIELVYSVTPIQDTWSERTRQILLPRNICAVVCET
jgi:hypothetical protein